MSRQYIDCREYPSTMHCSVALSADSEKELLSAAVQHAVFGRGVVTEFDGRFVTVEFSGMRVKKLDAALVAQKHLLWDL